MNESHWLRCEISDGQFSDEIVVKGKTSNGEGFSLFTTEKFVRFEGDLALGEVPGSVRVTVLDRQSGLSLVRLPNQTLENGYTITVNDSELEKSKKEEWA